MAKGLTLAEPPKRRSTKDAETSPTVAKAAPSPTLFAQEREGDKVQFNKRIDKSVADGFAMLAIKTGKKVPDLLREGLDALEAKYGKV